MDITISIITTLVLTVVNGYFSMSEMALTTAKRAVLDHEAEGGDRRAARAAELAANSGSFLATIQVAITLVGFASSAVASTSLSDPLAQWLSSFGIDALAIVAPGLAPVLITLAVSYLSIVVGELVPKRIALADAEGMAKRVAKPLTVFQKIARPARLADAGFRRRSRSHLAHQERRRPSECLRGGDPLHDQRAGHPARRGEAHHP